jgi:hypothetical protein
MSTEETMEPERRPIHAQPLSDADASRFLERVIELDAIRRDAHSERELRETAVELGIPSDLIDQALAELRHGMLPDRTVAKPSGRRSVVREALIFGALGAASFLPTALVGVSHLPAVLGIGAVAVALGLDSRRVDAMTRYLGRVGGLFAGFVLGGSTMFAFPLDAALGLFISLPVASGLLVLRLGNRLGRNRPSQIQQGPKGKREDATLAERAPLKGIGRWIADVFRRIHCTPAARNQIAEAS